MRKLHKDSHSLYFSSIVRVLKKIMMVGTCRMYGGNNSLYKISLESLWEEVPLHMNMDRLDG